MRAAALGLYIVRSVLTDRIAAAADEPVLTDAIAVELHRYALLGWILVFIKVLGGSLKFLGGAPEARSVRLPLHDLQRYSDSSRLPSIIRLFHTRS